MAKYYTFYKGKVFFSYFHEIIVHEMTFGKLIGLLREYDLYDEKFTIILLESIFNFVILVLGF